MPPSDAPSRDAPRTVPDGIFRGARTLSIMPTYTCPAACTHCASLSSPQVRTGIPLQVILDAIREAFELGFHNVVFTGGEATLRWSDLLRSIEYACELGLPTRLVTNAHWARSVEIATRKLTQLVDAGLDEINFSTGDEHARFIPVERVACAAVAAARRGFRSWIMVELRAERRVCAETVRTHPLIAALAPAERELIEVAESPWMPLSPAEIAAYPDGLPADGMNLKSHMNCPNVLQTYTVQADGRVGACCGIGMRTIPELSVATVDQAGFLARAIEEAESDFLKLWMHYKGPEQILAWAATKNPTIRWRGMYAHRCQACARVYKDPAIARVIESHYEEMLIDVLQSAWFDERFVPTATGTPTGAQP